MRIRITAPDKWDKALHVGEEFNVLSSLNFPGKFLLDHPDKTCWPHGYCMQASTKWIDVSSPELKPGTLNELWIALAENERQQAKRIAALEVSLASCAVERDAAVKRADRLEDNAASLSAALATEREEHANAKNRVVGLFQEIERLVTEIKELKANPPHVIYSSARAAAREAYLDARIAYDADAGSGGKYQALKDAAARADKAV